MSRKTVVVWMRVHEDGCSPANDERIEVCRFAWNPSHQLPREGETIVLDGLPLIVRHVEWGPPDPIPFASLIPEIEVSRRPDHPALKPDAEDGEAGP